MTERESTWQAHPVLGALVRVGVLLVPLALAVGSAVLLARTLPASSGLGGRALWWGAVLVGSTAVLAVADRAARRLLPLAVLLELSLVFPDKAPSRLRAARTPSVRELEDRLARLHGSGAGDEASQAAETLVTLVGILGLHDKRTRGHSERVRAFTDLLTEELGLPEEERQRARWAALVHDIGKLEVPGAVLNGGTDLDDAAWAQIRRHPEEGVRLAAGLLPWLGEWGRCVVEHHERFDGGGYPHGLAGEQISRAARIVSVCDSFEVMTSARSYNTVRSAGAARRELIRCAGTQFDPEVVRVFVGISLGRVMWVLGPLTWLAQLPLVGAVDKAGQLAKAGAVVAVVGGLVAGGALPGPAGVDRGRPPTTLAAPVPGGGPGGSAARGASPLSGSGPEGLGGAPGTFLPNGDTTADSTTDGSAGAGTGGGAAVGGPGTRTDGATPGDAGTTTADQTGTRGGTGASGAGGSSGGAGAVGSDADGSTGGAPVDGTAAGTTGGTGGTTGGTTGGPSGTTGGTTGSAPPATPTGASTAPPSTSTPAAPPAPPPASASGAPAGGAPTSTPPPAAEPAPAPAPQPSGTTVPDGGPSGPAGPTGTASATAAPASPSASPVPVTRQETLYLGSDGTLAPAAPAATAPTVSPLEPGTAAVFERPVDTATSVSGTASTVLHVRLVRDRGNGQRTGQVTATLSACAPSGACQVLASATTLVSQDATDTGFSATPVDLGAADGAVAAGGTLRLAVSSGGQGNSDRAELASGSASTPSRLVVTLTSVPAPSSGALPVAGVGLLTSLAAAAVRRRRDLSAPVGSHSHH